VFTSHSDSFQQWKLDGSLKSMQPEGEASEMNDTSMEPNLFGFAPSELSQDAVLCWLMSWADSKYQSVNGELQETGVRLLKLIFRKHGLSYRSEYSVNVRRQLDHADLVAEIEDKYLVLIEDKTKTNHHGDQLCRYIQIMSKKYSDRKVLPVFLKTEDQCDFADIESCGYCICNRSDVLSCIWPNKDIRINSDVLRNWAEYLNYKEQSVRAFKYKPIAQWDWGQWVGFYQELRHYFPDLGWKYVPNPSGGFMGAWWGWRTVGLEKLYLQIDGHNLCFRVAAHDAVNPSEIRERWYRWFMQHGAKNQTIRPQRPLRFGSGKTMTVAVVPREDWMRVNSDGVLDLPNTLHILRNATSFIKQARALR
jgi:hypothetical protein